MIQPDTCRAVARSWTDGSSKSGKPYVSVQYECLSGVNTGQTIRCDHYLSSGALKYTFEALRASGWVGSSSADMRGMGTLEVELVIELEEYEGKQYPKVKWVNAPGVSTARPIDAGVRKVIDAEIARLAAKFPPLAKPREPGEDDV
jgi:hypothetical protein